MEQFCVFRLTIREASRMPENELLVIVRPGSGGGAPVLVYEARRIAEPVGASSSSWPACRSRGCTLAVAVA